MKSLSTLQKEYLQHRLDLSQEFRHFVYCGDTNKATLHNLEIMRLDKILLSIFPGQISSNLPAEPTQESTGSSGSSHKSGSQNTGHEEE